MIFGMSTACFFPNVYTEQAVDIMGKMQAGNIEVFFSCMSEYKKSFINDLKQRISDNGINVYSVHALSTQFEPQLFSAQKRAKEEARGIYRQVLEAAAILGAKAYVFHGPSNVKHLKKLVLNYEYIAEVSSALADIAREFGVCLAWENVHWCWFSKPDFAEELLKQPGMENMYFTLDIKQAAQAGFSPSDYLKSMNGRLVNIHVCDYAISEERGVYPVLPFKGNMDFQAFKKDIIASGYDKALIYEVYRECYKDHADLFENYNKVISFFSK